MYKNKPLYHIFESQPKAYVLYLCCCFSWIFFFFHTDFFKIIDMYMLSLACFSLSHGTSLVAQTVKNLPAVWETWIPPWVGKIPWRRQWLCTPVFLPGECYGQRRCFTNIFGSLSHFLFHFVYLIHLYRNFYVTNALIILSPEF